VKNILLLAGLYFPSEDGSGGAGAPLLLDQHSALRALAGFAIFCALSSAIYLLNDAIDAPKDRLHPKKRHRPIASGELSVRAAIRISFILAALGLAGAYTLSFAFGLCASAYVGMEIAYCLGLKEVFLIDTMIISMGFILRAVSGIIVLRTPDQNVVLTPWFVICVLFLSLLLAFCKRRGELVLFEAQAVQYRSVLREYSREVLDMGIAVCSTATILAYALYSVENPKPWFMLSTLPFVIFGVFRYLYLAYKRGQGDAPEEVFLGDPALLSCVVFWSFSLALVFYQKG
jgi:4-hydroxybenzoate polyprenyltransferase